MDLVDKLKDSLFYLILGLLVLNMLMLISLWELHRMYFHLNESVSIIKEEQVLRTESVADVQTAKQEMDHLKELVYEHLADELDVDQGSLDYHNQGYE